MLISLTAFPLHTCRAWIVANLGHPSSGVKHYHHAHYQTRQTIPFKYSDSGKQGLDG